MNHQLSIEAEVRRLAGDGSADRRGSNWPVHAAQLAALERHLDAQPELAEHPYLKPRLEQLRDERPLHPEELANCGRLFDGEEPDA